MIKTMFDNLNTFSAGDFAEANKQLYDNGVICPSGETTIAATALKVTNSSGNALIGNGSALIKGRIITVSGETVTLSTDGTYKIVLEWSAASDGSQLKALSGSEKLEQTDTQYQLLLATVAKSGTSLTVTDGRIFINRMTDDQAINLQTAQQTGWTKVDVALALADSDTQTHTYYFSAPSSIASVLQFGTKVKFTQDSTVKYATIKSITVSGNTATIYFGSDVEITGSVITDIYCNNSLPMGFPQNFYPIEAKQIIANSTNTTISSASAYTQKFGGLNTMYLSGNIITKKALVYGDELGTIQNFSCPVPLTHVINDDTTKAPVAIQIMADGKIILRTANVATNNYLILTGTSLGYINT